MCTRGDQHQIRIRRIFRNGTNVLYWGRLVKFSLPFCVKTLLNGIFAFLMRQFLGASSVKRHSALLNPLQWLLPRLHGPAYAHPVLGSLARNHTAPPVHRLSFESPYFSLRHNDLFSFQMSLQNISGEQIRMTSFRHFAQNDKPAELTVDGL